MWFPHFSRNYIFYRGTGNSICLVRSTFRGVSSPKVSPGKNHLPLSHKSQLAFWIFSPRHLLQFSNLLEKGITIIIVGVEDRISIFHWLYHMKTIHPPQRWKIKKYTEDERWSRRTPTVLAVSQLWHISCLSSARKDQWNIGPASESPPPAEAPHWHQKRMLDKQKVELQTLQNMDWMQQLCLVFILKLPIASRM